MDPGHPNSVTYGMDNGLEPVAKIQTFSVGRHLPEKMITNSRPGTTKSMLAPPPPVYMSPESPARVAPVGSGQPPPRIWTVEGDKDVENAYDSEDHENGEDYEEDDDTNGLLEKEFDDFFEDKVHKSAGPVVFLSKMLGMLPVIWTEEESESECKSYFNLYTFVIFVGWVALAVMTALRCEKVAAWPGDIERKGDNMTDPLRFLTKPTIDTYFSCSWIASLIALLFGVFKCRSFAEVLFGLSETDAQLEMKEKQYDKIKRKSLYWIAFLIGLLAAHSFAFYTILADSEIFDILIFMADILAHATVFVLDLQFLHLAMVLCKRYRTCNKLLSHITKPWKTFREEKPPNYILQNVLQYRFDQFFDPTIDMNGCSKSDLLKKDVPLEMLLKGGEDSGKISKEEENAFILKLDILRGIHADLNALAHEMDHLLGFQILVHLISSVIFVVMFGYFFSSAMMDEKFYWPYLVLCLLPAVRIFLIGHWGQVLEKQSRQPFMTICQISTIDGSPRLERQVQKLTIQMHHQCPNLTAAGYFTLGRNMILKTIGMAVIFTFFMVKFEQSRMMTLKSATASAT